jgi:hypothetical protein
LATITAAPGTIAPLASWTVPVSDPYSTWASNARTAEHNRRRTNALREPFIAVSLAVLISIIAYR